MATLLEDVPYEDSMNMLRNKWHSRREGNEITYCRWTRSEEHRVHMDLALYVTSDATSNVVGVLLRRPAMNATAGETLHCPTGTVWWNRQRRDAGMNQCYGLARIDPDQGTRKDGYLRVL